MKMKYGNKFWEWHRHGGKIPRKTKKKILGLKMPITVLRKKLRDIELGKPIKTMYETRSANMELFCPHCGCEGYAGTGNRTCYPEHWETFYCIRCRKPVGYIDNSPFIHALECAPDYDPCF